MIFQLDNTTEFPDPRYGNADGFYAVGGEVTPERLAKAYPMEELLAAVMDEMLEKYRTILSLEWKSRKATMTTPNGRMQYL